jgi:hypothetical protein
MNHSVLVIACGALARELAHLKRLNDWPHVAIRCLPAELHNRPEKIAPAVAAMIEAERERHAGIFVAYADCGTGGALDRVLAEHGIERLPGAHCYEFFAGSSVFDTLSETEPGTFYLTDFLVRSFDRLVRKGLGLDRHPELRDAYFGNYRRLVYLSQVADPGLEAQARAHAAFLGLDYLHQPTGFEPFGRAVSAGIAAWPS